MGAARINYGGKSDLAVPDLQQLLEKESCSFASFEWAMGCVDELVTTQGTVVHAIKTDSASRRADDT